MSISCRDRVQHRPSWVVLDLDWCRTAEFPHGWSSPGTHTVSCELCRVAWRSSAKYVRELPDARPIRIARLFDEHPLLIELSYWIESGALAGYIPFLHDLARQLYVTGSLSSRQIEVGQDAIRNHIARMNWMQEHADESA